MIIEGSISVKAAIQAHKREIQEVYIDRHKKTKDFNYIRKLCRNEGIKLTELEKEELKSFLNGKTSGGIAAEVKTRKSDELTEGDIFLVDGIEDPFNIGYIARTVYALGVNNLILPKRDYENMEAQILKSSAGAYDFLSVLYSDNLYECISSLKERYTVYALKRSDDSKDIFELKFKDPAVYMLGGEKRGLSAEIEKLTDENIFISYGNPFRNSLNGASAAAVLAALRYSQKRK